MERHPTTRALVPDADKFPRGMESLADYVHSKGLLMGIYTSRGSHTCQGRPGSKGFEDIDAQTFASWGVDYLKEDSCMDADPTTFDDPSVAWGQYARMRDALNKTGRPVWFSITARVEYNDSQWHVRLSATRYAKAQPRPSGSTCNYTRFCNGSAPSNRMWRLYRCTTAGGDALH